MFPKTFEEACASRGYDAATVLPDVSNYPAKHRAALTAHAKMVIVAEVINDAWEPDWNDSNEFKWIPWWDMEVDDRNPSGFRFDGAYCVNTFTYSSGGSRLCFKTEKACEYAAEQFLDLWRDMMVIKK